MQGIAEQITEETGSALARTGEQLEAALAALAAAVERARGAGLVTGRVR